MLDLYCGIGGLAAALERGPAGAAAAEPGGIETVAAVDVNRRALAVYRHNFPRHETVAAVVESLADERWRRFRADLWWLSPPCQPFTRRGLGRDLDDPRAASFPSVLKRLAEEQPSYLALENVPPFRRSRARALLVRTLEQAGYQALVETVLCPSELGFPNRRRRYYLVAGRERLLPVDRGTRGERRPRLCDVLDPQPAPELWVERRLVERYREALDVVDAGDPAAVTNCFTSAYGRSPVRSGSYLRTEHGVRRFSPAEILRLLGFPASFELPPGLALAKTWRLVGNSLSIPAVRAVLATIPEVASRSGRGRAGRCGGSGR